MFKQYIKEIVLLSKEEWEEIVATVPNIPIDNNEYWWLRSPAKNYFDAMYVRMDGSVCDHGAPVNYSYAGVRPALRIPIPKGYKVGDKIKVGSTMCTMVAFDLLLVDQGICSHSFDTSNNNYDTSEIKEYINSEEFLEML